MSDPIYYRYYPSPIGQLLLLAQQDKLIYIEFEPEQQTTPLEQCLSADETSGEIWSVFCKTTAVLDRYFAGEKVDFSPLDFLSPKGTPFQQQVWQILREIPYGQTTTYGEIAKLLGKPSAMRAVGGAVGRNPISILIPCHRVLGQNQTLTGFGGGLPTKRFLLQLEQIPYHDKGIEFVNPKHKPYLNIVR